MGSAGGAPRIETLVGAGDVALVGAGIKGELQKELGDHREEGSQWRERRGGGGGGGGRWRGSQGKS